MALPSPGAGASFRCATHASVPLFAGQAPGDLLMRTHSRGQRVLLGPGPDLPGAAPDPALVLDAGAVRALLAVHAPEILLGPHGNAAAHAAPPGAGASNSPLSDLLASMSNLLYAHAAPQAAHASNLLADLQARVATLEARLEAAQL